MGGCAFGGLTKATYTQISADVVANTKYVQFYASGTAEALAHVNIGDLPSGGTVSLLVSGSYFV
jgi:hypothetical protein